MLKVEENVFLFNCTFCQMALYCVCVVSKQYIPPLPCSVYDLLVVFCVSCTVKALYKCPSPSELWYRCLVPYVLLLTEKKEKSRVELEEAGSGRGTVK